MTPDRWQHVKEITANALEHDPDSRISFVKAASQGDEKLRNEVLLLLSQCENAPASFLSEDGRNVRETLGAMDPLPFSFRTGQIVSNRFEIQRFVRSEERRVGK